ncbi:hypothetical protein [Micromonospora sp. NPDC050276]|uniref:hypothetical protein n=1 Tax=Micromonospora sp. NPDC050276 TaxID=3364278 RepID=UPI0037B88B9A
MRRVREMELAGQPKPHSDLPEPGTLVGEFIATTLDGRTISEAIFAHGPSSAVFLISGCSSCSIIVEELARSCADDAPLVVFLGGSASDPEVRTVIEALPDHAVVALIDPISHPARKAMKVSAYPAVLNIVDGVVTYASSRMTSETRQTVNEG